MYVPVTTEDFDKWIKAESRTFETRCDVIIGNTTYRLSGSGLSGDIISMQWNNVVCSNDGLQIGTSCMDEFRMEYRNNNSIPSLMNSEIHPYVGLVIPHENTGDVTVWIPLGVFYVTNTETNDDGRTYTITAYDGMQKFMGNVVWADIGITEFPVNAWTLLTAIASHFNVTVSYDDVVYQLLSSDDYVLYSSDGLRLVAGGGVDGNKNTAIAEPLEGTYREYIGWIAGLVGANAHMGRTGDLVISRYADHGYSIGRNIQHMGGAKINYGGAVTYTAIVSGTDSDPVYSSSRTGNAITYTNPFITTVELDRVCDVLLGDDGITVTPCNVEWRSDPRIDAGDIVSVEGSDGNFYSVYVMDRTVTITGGLSEVLNCYGETEIAKALNTSPLVTKINQLSQTTLRTADMINNTKGTMRMLVNEDGSNYGYEIVENDGVSWLRCTAGGLGLSNNGGLTYTNAITKDGVTASQLHVIRNGVEVMSADEGSNGLPELVMRDAEGEDLLLISPYIVGGGAVENAETGTRFRMYDNNGSLLAYIGTLGNNTTGKITGSSMRLFDAKTPSDSYVTASSSIRNNSDTGGTATVGVYDPKSGNTAATLSTNYFDDPTFAPPNGAVTCWDTINGYRRVQMLSYGTSTVRQGRLEFTNYDTSTQRNDVMLGIYSDGKNTPYITIYDNANNVTRTLSLRPIMINGTNYYIMAGT